MHSIRLDIANNLLKNEIKTMKTKVRDDDWSHLEPKIDMGLNSGINHKSHEKVISDIKSNYLNRFNKEKSNAKNK